MKKKYRLIQISVGLKLSRYYWLELDSNCKYLQRGSVLDFKKALVLESNDFKEKKKPIL